MRLTDDQRRALDGESGDPASPRAIGVQPDTPMIESCFDPGGCEFVFERPARTGFQVAGWDEHAGWRCALTAGHSDDHVPGYPPGFDLEDS